jgi:hypothetical protein
MESAQHVAVQKASDTASDNNDDGTVDEDRKDVADAKMMELPKRMERMAQM